MTIWLVSDTHFGHENIIRYCARPFANAAEMDAAMIERWNAVVKPEDHVWHLGDVAMRTHAMRAIVPQLHGHKRLLRGNHDIFATADYVKVGFKEVAAYRVIDNVICSHIPIHELSLKLQWLGNIHGHIHERPSFGPRYLNVSVEQTDYRPITLEDAKARLRKQIESGLAAVERLEEELAAQDHTSHTLDGAAEDDL